MINTDLSHVTDEVGMNLFGLLVFTPHHCFVACVPQVSVRAARIRPSCRRLPALCTPAPLRSPASCLRPWRRTLVCGSTRPSPCARPSSSRTRTSGGQSQSTSSHLQQLNNPVLENQYFLFMIWQIMGSCSAGRYTASFQIAVFISNLFIQNSVKIRIEKIKLGWSFLSSEDVFHEGTTAW